MSMNDPLGDMLTRIRNAQMRGKVHCRARLRPSFGPGCSMCWPTKAISAATRRSTGQPTGIRRSRSALKYYEGEPGHPRTEARFEAGTPCLHGCEGHSDRSVRVWVFPSSRRRAASCRMQMHARPMSAAKCFARSSEEVLDVSNWKTTGRAAVGVSASVSGQTVDP